MQFHCCRCAYYAAFVILAASGCGQSTATKPSAAPSAGEKLSPEQSFELIVETFRRGVEDVAVGFVMADESGGHSMLTGKNQVSHQLIPPAEAGGQYKGIITVASESRYSIQRSTEEGSSESDEEQSGQKGNSFAADDQSGTEIYDSELVSGPKTNEPQRPTTTTKPKKGEVTVDRQLDKNVREYELIYQNGRWQLTTKLDSNTEKSIQFAFERALDSQN